MYYWVYFTLLFLICKLKKMRYIGNTPKMPKPGIIRGRKGLKNKQLKTEPESPEEPSGTGVSL